ncbi:unnamed protein product, partial [Sphacelaria rigidula]
MACRTETGMDYRIKKGLVFDTLRLLNVQVGAREAWQAEIEQAKRGRLLGFPRRKEGGPAGAGAGIGGVDSEAKEQKRAKREKRSRLAAERAREEHEQSVKGGFERIFPPSHTAPNRGARYTKVVRVAEAVFARISGYPSSPRSRSPSPARHKGVRHDNREEKKLVINGNANTQLNTNTRACALRRSLKDERMPTSPGGSTPRSCGPPRSPRESSGVTRRPGPPSVVTEGRATTPPGELPARSTASVGGEAAAEEAPAGEGDPDNITTPDDDESNAATSHSPGSPKSPSRLRGLKGGDLSGSPPSSSRRKKKTGKGDGGGGKRGSGGVHGSRSPTRRRGRRRGGGGGGCTGGRDWVKEAKRRKKIYKKTAKVAGAHATGAVGVNGVGGPGGDGAGDGVVFSPGTGERWGQGEQWAQHQQQQHQHQQQYDGTQSAVDLGPGYGVQNPTFEQSNLYTQSMLWPAAGGEGGGDHGLHSSRPGAHQGRISTSGAWAGM